MKLALFLTAAAWLTFAAPAHGQNYDSGVRLAEPHASDAEQSESGDTMVIIVTGHRVNRDIPPQDQWEDSRDSVVTTVDNEWGQGRVTNTRRFFGLGGADIGSITTGTSPYATSNYGAPERNNDVPQPRISCSLPLSESCLRWLHN